MFILIYYCFFVVEEYCCHFNNCRRNMSSKIYPIGIQNFEKIRKDGYFYIDKTALIYQMVKTGSYYFLSCPRRFGKSLLISTLEVYFLGKKELFEGLAIEKLEKNWTIYPIFFISTLIRRSMIRGRVWIAY